MTDNQLAGSSPWLATLIGQAWAPQPPKLSSERVQTIATRGLADPAGLSDGEIRELAASVIAHGRRPAEI